MIWNIISGVSAGLAVFAALFAVVSCLHMIGKIADPVFKSYFLFCVFIVCLLAGVGTLIASQKEVILSMLNTLAAKIAFGVTLVPGLLLLVRISIALYEIDNK